MEPREWNKGGMGMDMEPKVMTAPFFTKSCLFELNPHPLFFSLTNSLYFSTAISVLWLVRLIIGSHCCCSTSTSLFVLPPPLSYFFSSAAFHPHHHLSIFLFHNHHHSLVSSSKHHCYYPHCHHHHNHKSTTAIEKILFPSI